MDGSNAVHRIFSKSKMMNGLIHARIWHQVDAKDKILGKLAQRISIALRGKYKPHYNPAIDSGDYVIVTNASKVALSG